MLVALVFADLLENLLALRPFEKIEGNKPSDLLALRPFEKIEGNKPSDLLAPRP